MKYDILMRPSYALVEVRLEDREELVAESGVMVYKSANVSIETSMKGGLLNSLKRSVLGGESFFMNTFKSSGEGTVGLSSPYPGDIVCHELEEVLFAQSTSFLACSKDVSIDTKFGGLKTFFAREGLFLLKMEGRGLVFLSSFGGIIKKDLPAGEKFAVDTGYIVAFTENMTFEVKRVGGLKTTLLSGEGLVSEFQGPGTLYLQTKSVAAFVGWMMPFLPRDDRGGFSLR